MVNAANGWTTARIESAKAEFERLGEPQRIPGDWSRPDQGLVWHHAVMNLPRTAVSFCDAFAGTFKAGTWPGQLPLVHCYTFQKSETDAGAHYAATFRHDANTIQHGTCADVIMRVETALGAALDEPAVVHKVRLVAPEKHHVCITFRIPRAVAFECVGPNQKRLKTQGK